jgi:hypothetical protein
MNTYLYLDGGLGYFSRLLLLAEQPLDQQHAKNGKEFWQFLNDRRETADIPEECYERSFEEELAILESLD